MTDERCRDCGVVLTADNVCEPGTCRGCAAEPLVGEVLWAGEEGEWIVAEGHVDLAAFTKAADALSREDIPGLDDDELPSKGFTAAHVWLRPMTWEYFTRHYGPEGDTAVYDAMCEEGAMESCGPDDEGAQAWTTIATGA